MQTHTLSVLHNDALNLYQANSSPVIKNLREVTGVFSLLSFRNSNYNMITTKAKLATICDSLVLYLILQAMQNHTKFPTLLQCKRKK